MTGAGPAASFRAALVQMRSGRDLDSNMRDATALIREAASGGAHYVQTPEVTTLMELERERLFAAAEPEEGNRALAQFKSLAAELSIWLHIGSMIVRVSDDKLANRAFLISPAGEVTARYDKIHMFDVDLPNGETYRESTNYAPGAHAVVADLPWGPIGFSICYDLRFPHLYRALAHAGARFLAIPAAFTRVTGEAHWIDAAEGSRHRMPVLRLCCSAGWPARAWPRDVWPQCHHLAVGAGTGRRGHSSFSHIC